MTPPDVRRITAEDLRRYADDNGLDVPEWVQPVGYSAFVGGEIVGIGCAFLSGASMWMLLDAPALHGQAMLLHRLAVRLLSECRESGFSVRVLRDDDLETSKRWLERLGFEPTGETMNDREVWICPV